MRRAGRWLAAPFYLVWLVITLLFRVMSEAFRAARWVAYYTARFIGGGTFLSVIPAVLCVTLYMIYADPKGGFGDAPGFYMVAIGTLICRMFWRKLAPGPRRARAPKPVKPAEIPVVAGSARRPDDPSESAIIARLPSHLRSLLSDAKQPVQGP